MAEIIENVGLSDFTTFNIGGRARYFTAAGSEDDLLRAVSYARERSLPIFVLGGGSNLLVSDDGFDGLVIHNRILGTAVDCDSGLVSAGAGVAMDELIGECVESSLQGLECLSGIPGTVGAAPVQNIGAYGQSVQTSVVSVRVLDVGKGLFTDISPDECKFGYRRSIFNTEAVGRYVITRVELRLAPGGMPSMQYQDLKRYMGGNEAFSLDGVTLKEVRNAVLQIRAAKGMVLLKGYDGFKSAGSFFKNPTIDDSFFKEVSIKVGASGGCLNWAWPTTDGKVKVSAACMIELAGFVRGYRAGNVGVSPKHTLSLINYGGGTAREVLSLAKDIREAVFEKYGVTLETEVNMLGFNATDFI